MSRVLTIIIYFGGGDRKRSCCCSAPPESSWTCCSTNPTSTSPTTPDCTPPSSPSTRQCLCTPTLSSCSPAASSSSTSSNSSMQMAITPSNTHTSLPLTHIFALMVSVECSRRGCPLTTRVRGWGGTLSNPPNSIWMQFWVRWSRTYFRTCFSICGRAIS